MEPIKPTIIRERRRTIALQIKPDATIVVKAPYLIPTFLINKFIKEKEAWIRAKLKQVQAFPQPSKKQFIDGEQFLYLGKSYKLQIVHNNAIELGESLLFPFKNKRSIKTKLINWYKENALATVTKRVEEYAKLMNVTYKDINLSNAKMRWGACSSRNELSFNWRLIMAPMHIMDYVVVHELAHTLEHNHSKKFWAHVLKYCPDYKIKRNWLKAQGKLLEIIW